MISTQPRESQISELCEKFAHKEEGMVTIILMIMMMMMITMMMRLPELGNSSGKARRHISNILLPPSGLRARLELCA